MRWESEPGFIKGGSTTKGEASPACGCDSMSQLRKPAGAIEAEQECSRRLLLQEKSGRQTLSDAVVTSCQARFGLIQEPGMRTVCGALDCSAHDMQIPQ
jgi:hypothetical protein